MKALLKEIVNKYLNKETKKSVFVLELVIGEVIEAAERELK
jgi:hypothetical protein